MRAEECRVTLPPLTLIPKISALQLIFFQQTLRFDPDKIGILGICGWGGMAVNAAAIDTRIKATVAATMYDMSRVTANGYFDSMDANGRYALKRTIKRTTYRRL